ncbi:tat pathway signal sequence [Podospora appendiculata]|uniref:Tat pathway signal sequence n=1 Tax=Podospora appendiculata TaxID=314037 RepID=A0AAE1C900_9PEZI|nr:tat pathway signal sequence [Podospora appendiculata]
MLFTKKKRDRRSAWGYNFDWTSDHLTPEQLRPLMFSYDVLATESLDRLDKLSPAPPSTTTTTTATTTTGGDNDEKPPRCHRDLCALLEQHAPEDETLNRLWTEVTTVPAWVDWAQIARGQKVFYRYAGPSVVALTFHSLLGGMGSRRVVETLARTGGFGVHVARRRLLETFQHILDVTQSLASIQPGGAGFKSSIQVRLLHASVRRRILRLAHAQPCYYDTASLGVPINDLDSIATVLTFSATLLHMGFPRQGIVPTAGEGADYLALWRYVAHLLGTPTDGALSTPARAEAMMESLLAAEIAPTATSQRLAGNIIAGLQNTPPTFASADFLRAEAYWLNGHRLAAALALPRPPWYYTLLVAGQCLVFMALCYAKRAVPAWDEASIRRLRVRMRALTLDLTDHQEATHTFQYVPSLGFTAAEEEEEEEEGGDVKDGAQSRLWRRRRRMGTVERRNLNAVLVAAALVGGMAWLGLRSVSASSLFYI